MNRAAGGFLYDLPAARIILCRFCKKNLLTTVADMDIIICNTLKRRVRCGNMKEKGDGSRRGYGRPIVAGWKHLHGKHLKTTSEWP